MSARKLFSCERTFLTELFGDSLVLPRIRVARSIHPRRCWSPYGGRISLVRRCFEAENPDRPVNLADPAIAATFAHEALHVWQRQRGRWVTWEGARLQVPYAVLGRNPYGYPKSVDPQVLLQTFLAGNIEQQGQLFQDYVLARGRGADISAYEAVAAHVRGSKSDSPEQGLATREL